MRTVIKANCNDQVLKIIDSPIIASGGFHENYIQFEFCEKWNGFEKVAVFYVKETEPYYSYIDANNMCEIPHEVTDNPGKMYFGVYGVLGDVTRTSVMLKYHVDKGPVTDDLKPSDPTPDIWEQLISKSNALQAETTRHLNDKENPHGVTKDQVGLGNVPNVSTEDQTPMFEMASVRANISSGEKLKLILGKISKVFNDMRSSAFKDVANNCDMISDGYVLDARQGTKLKEDMSQLSNPNLLINGDFQVWQRGTSLTSNGSKKEFVADRWCIWCNSTVSRNDGLGLKITINGVDYGGLHQFIEVSEEMYQNLLNRDVTLSARFSVSRDMNMSFIIGSTMQNFKAKSGGFNTYTFTTRLTENNFTSIANTRTLQVTPIYADPNNKYSVGDEIQLSYVKLEVGSIATPFVPRLYAEELAMCQRYYRKIEKTASILGYYSDMQKYAVGFDYSEMRKPVTYKSVDIGSLTSSNEWVHFENVVEAIWSQEKENGRFLTRQLNATFYSSNVMIYAELDSEIY